MTRLKRLADPKNVAGMKRFGINPKGTLGISIPTLRRFAREIGRDHDLALRLWKSGFHEARILAGFVADPAQLTSAQAERWVNDFDSWDVCDQVAALFEQMPFARKKIRQWAASDREFVKRAAFAMIAGVAVHDTAAGDGQYEPFLQLIKRGSTDDRNFVKKAVNWALRGIGKRNRPLNRRAIAVAKEIALMDSSAARWIAADALRELKSPAVRQRFHAARRSTRSTS
ncbi:MAG: DNA alkylation repair protein [Armatimonadetes bacterium 13_1_20CM_4_65_7]|nr:MAG: DNA alkylation repair protein [Armatimonadetes bacterium 13_1_20CM_4_65_7]